MTEHCVNNDTGTCQTQDATHLILTYKIFRADKTIGHTYTGERADLAFHLAADPEAPVYRLKLFVANHTDRTWNVLLYENPHDYTSPSSITTLPAKSEIQLYTLREYEFSNKKKVLVFFRFGDKLFDIDREELLRLWKCLNSLNEQPVFADMMVSNEAADHIPAHRAVLAAASQVLCDAVSSLEPIAFEEEANSLSAAPDANTSSPENDDNEEDDDESVKEPENDDDDDDENDSNLFTAFKAFANAVVKTERPDNEEALIENLKETIEAALDVKIIDETSSDVVIEQPNPKRYMLVANGLRPRKYLEVMLSYIYTGRFNMKPKSDDRDYVDFIRKLDDMLSVIYMFKISGLIGIIEGMLKTFIREHTAVDLLQLANQYNLGKLKTKVVQYLRRPTYVQILDGIKDGMVHKCIIANASHKNQSQTYSKYSGSMAKVWPCFQVYLFGYPVLISLKNPNAYMPKTLRVYLQVDNEKRSSKHFVGILINTLELTFTSHQNNVERLIIHFDQFNVTSRKEKYFNLISWTKFLEDGYCENYIVNVEVYIEANTDYLALEQRPNI